MALTQVSSNAIKDGSLLNADINANAAIASSKLAKPIDLGDNEKIRLGASNDLEIFHDSSNGNSHINESGSGSLVIKATNTYINSSTDEQMIAANADGAVELYHDNSKKFETTSDGATITGSLTVTDDITLQDDLLMGDTDAIKLGDNADLQIYHDGSTNIIDGQFHPIELRHQSEVHIKCVDDGAVELYHDNSKKFYTTSDGIESNSELHFKAPSNISGEQVGRIEWWNENDAGVMAKIAVDRTASAAAPADLVFSTSANVDTTANGGDGDISEKCRILSTGGLTFNGDTADANALDDYEEGTFTPYINGTNANGSWSAGSGNGGFYVKIGKQVTCWINCAGTLSGASGNMNVYGLPFSSAGTNQPAGAGNSNYSSGSCQYWAGSNVDILGALVPSGNTYIYFHSDNGQSTGNQPTVGNGSHNLHCQVTYFVA